MKQDIFIPVMKPKLIEWRAASRYLQEMDENGIFTNRGPLVIALEERFAEFFDVRMNQVATCSSATLGIQGVASLASASHFYAPNYTFPATILSLINSGKSFEVLDIKSSDWQIDLSNKNVDQSFGVLCVLPFGAKGDATKYTKFGSVIFDAAASIAQFKSSLSSIEHNTVYIFSLHATKVLGIGEGAVIVFGDENLAKEFRQWTNFGFDSNRKSVIIGTNAKMSEITAAYGLATLDNFEMEFDEWKRQRIVSHESDRQLGIRPSNRTLNVISPYRIVEFASPEIKSHVRGHLKSHGVDSREWWGRGCHKMPAFSNFAHLQFHVTDLISARTLGLPFYRSMSTAELEFIEDLISEALSCKNSSCPCLR